MFSPLQRFHTFFIKYGAFKHLPAFGCNFCHMSSTFVINRFPYACYSTRSRKHQKKAHDYNSDDDDDESDDEMFEAEVEHDPYLAEDEKFNPGFRHLTSFVKSPRFDKVIRVGLNLTRAAAEEAFLSSRFRLNGIKLLKKSVLVCPGDKLDLVISEDDGTLGKRVRVITVEERKRDSYRVSLRCWRSKVKL